MAKLESASRRSVVKGAAALAALAIPAAAVAVGDDAELLRLGAELDALYPLKVETREACAAMCDAADDEVDRRLGFSPRQGFKMTDEQGEQYMAVAREVYATGADAAVWRDTAVWETVDVIHGKILNLPAHTAAGVAVKARALAMFYQWNLWQEERPDDWGDQILRDLIEAVCKLACTTPGVVSGARPGGPRAPRA
jgi:hypothetical protein